MIQGTPCLSLTGKQEETQQIMFQFTCRLEVIEKRLQRRWLSGINIDLFLPKKFDGFGKPRVDRANGS